LSKSPQNMSSRDIEKSSYNFLSFTWSLNRNSRHVCILPAGFTINLSADDLAEADGLAKKKAGPVVVILPASAAYNHVERTPDGRKVIICPEAYRTDVQCVTCRLCADPKREAVVAFPAHGAAIRRVRARGPRKGGEVTMHYAPIYRISLVRDGRLPYEVMLRQSSDVVHFVRPLFEGLDREQLVVVLLNAKHRPIGANVVSVGSLSSAIVHPREVFKPAIAGSAAAIVAAHNHPSGDPAPSAEDIEITRRLRQAGDLIGIKLVDHVILGGGTHFSFVDAGHW
jgi:DNA repair protein RadC